MITHEPECPMNLPIGEMPPNTVCPFCPVIRAAYQRGREDAAKAVEAALNDYVYGEEYGPPEFRLIAAARGKQPVISVVTDNLRDFKATHVFTEYGTITLGGDGEQK